MSEFNIEDLDAVIAQGREGSLAQMLALQLKGQIKKAEQLAAENMALKSKGKELLGEACAVYSKLNKLIDPAIGDFVDGQTLHEFQFVLDAETPATAAYLAGVKADGVEEWVSSRGGRWNGTTEEALKFAKWLREGGK